MFGKGIIDQALGVSPQIVRTYWANYEISSNGYRLCIYVDMFEKFAEITVFSIEFEVEVLHLKLYCSRFELCTENDTAPTLNFIPDNGEQASLRIKCVVVLRPWPNLLIQIIPEGSITTRGRSFCVDEVSLLSFFETIPMELGNGLLEFTKATNQHRVVLTADTINEVIGIRLISCVNEETFFELRSFHCDDIIFEKDHVTFIPSSDCDYAVPMHLRLEPCPSIRFEERMY